MTRIGDEQQQAREWVYARLSTSQALADALGVPLNGLPDRVWPDVAQAGTKSPWVVFSTGPSQDRAAVGPEARISTLVPLDVRATVQGRSYTLLAPVARAVYAALHGRTNDDLADGGVMLCAKRTDGIQYPEKADGVEYRHLGHTFQVEIN
jgi:hypothetical protein